MYGVKRGDTAVLLNYSVNLHLGYFCNNIFQNYETPVDIDNYSGNSIDNDDNTFFYDNINSHTSQGWTPKGTVYTKDPGLVDPTNADFSISNLENVKDQGTNLSNFSAVDYQHKLRDSLWDVGAFEYTGISTGSNAPVPPSNLGIVLNQ
jgi:hypothetical protein